eukprot:TRINITY_DN269_c0_g1_i6.p1 TRINITY_DN269_c0_g1~~TRINITY_DN269_c0_g1_i6.p1  ORF type:complete len:278 (+),score=54.45 TRINITY_DN269_c0_g1_i6:134-967(+)
MCIRDRYQRRVHGKAKKKNQIQQPPALSQLIFMKFHIAYPIAGTQKLIDIDDDKKYSIFFDKSMDQEVPGDQLGEDFKGYVFKITGGNDKDGFSMKKGVFVKGRVRLLLTKGAKNYRPRKTGERKRKSVRGCIVGPDICVLALAIVQKGEKDIPGLTDNQKPRRLGPKRVNKIKKLFGLKKKDDIALVKKNVIRRKFTSKTGKERQKAPKIQRIITPLRLRRKRIYKEEKKNRWQKSKDEAKKYHELILSLRKQKASQKAAEKKGQERSKKRRTKKS